MLCEKCKKMIVLHAMSTSECEKCGKKVTTPHIPSYRICEECSFRLGYCAQCGKDVNINK